MCWRLEPASGHRKGGHGQRPGQFPRGRSLGEPGYLPTEGFGAALGGHCEVIFAKCRAHSRCSAEAGQDPRPGSHSVFLQTRHKGARAQAPRRGTRRFPPKVEVGGPHAHGSSPGRGLRPSTHRPRPAWATPGHHLGRHHRPQWGIPCAPAGQGGARSSPQCQTQDSSCSPRGELRQPHPTAGALSANHQAWTQTVVSPRVPPPVLAPSGPLSTAPPSGSIGGPRGASRLSGVENQGPFSDMSL